MTCGGPSRKNAKSQADGGKMLAGFVDNVDCPIKLIAFARYGRPSPCGYCGQCCLTLSMLSMLRQGQNTRIVDCGQCGHFGHPF